MGIDDGKQDTAELLDAALEVVAANRLPSALEGAMIYQLAAREDGEERWVGSYITAVLDALSASPHRRRPPSPRCREATLSRCVKCA